MGEACMRLFVALFMERSMSRTPRRKKDANSSSRSRVLIECSPHRTTGGGVIAGLTVDHAEHESPHERLALASLALCRDVLSLASQPPADTYVDADGKTHRYTPDFVVTTPTRRVILEIKSLADLVREESMCKYMTIARHYVAQRQPYAFLVDAQLEETPRAASVRLLFRYATSTAPAPVVEKAASALASGPMRIEELLRVASLELVDAYTLLATRKLCFDWSQPLSRETCVSLPDQPYGGLSLDDRLRATRFHPLLAELAVGRRPADPSLLADAAAWRQSRRDATPFCFVGGFANRKVLRDLGDAECLPRAPARRRAGAPGSRHRPTDVGD
jgi:hypothetical protein